MKKSDDIDALAVALAAFQGAMTAVAKTASNPFFKSKYADLASIWEHIRALLSANGLSVVQASHPVAPWIVAAEDGKVLATHFIEIETMLIHISGQWISDRCRVPLAKVDPQGAGSAMTYARRYGLSAMLGLVSDDDDDGNAGSGNNTPPSQNNAPMQNAINNAPPKQPPAPAPPAPTAPAEDIFGHGAAAAEKDTIVAICKKLGAAGDTITTHKALGEYVLDRFDEPLAKLSVKAVKVLIEELNERLAERSAMAAEPTSGGEDGLPSHTGPNAITAEQLVTITKLCEIKNYAFADCALEYSGGETDDLAMLTEPQAREAIKKVQKMKKIEE